jgi:hypothetical protein
MLSSQSLFRVLVLDDEPMVLALLGHLFVGMGCAVELVEGGGEALGYVRDQPWNLVVLDQQVPHVQGGDPVPRRSGVGLHLTLQHPGMGRTAGTGLPPHSCQACFARCGAQWLAFFWTAGDYELNYKD